MPNQIVRPLQRTFKSSSTVRLLPLEQWIWQAPLDEELRSIQLQLKAFQFQLEDIKKQAGVDHLLTDLEWAITGVEPARQTLRTKID